MSTHDEVAAILTFRDPANYSARGKKSIIAWLRRQERKLQRSNHKMGKQYRARYIYQEDDGCKDT
jgi:hypothetical protein